MSACSFKERIDRQWPVWAAATLKVWMRFVRVTLMGVEQTRKGPCAVAIWHGDELALIPRFGHLGPTLLVSRSRDGERMARAAQALGYRVTRGSSTRGAVGGLIALIRAVKEGNAVVLTVDGPQGPRGVCKPGIVRVVQKTGAPLFPVGVAVSHRYVFKNTWNQVYLPFPFSRQVVLVDRPVFFPKVEGPEAMEHHCRQVEAALWKARKKAKELLLGRQNTLL